MLDKTGLTLLAAKMSGVDLPNRSSAESVLAPLLTSVYVVAGLVAVIGIVIGGFWYVTSNGEADKIKRGKNAIIYSCVGIVIIMLAWGITGFISGRVQV